MPGPDVDVAVIGAGFSGIGAAIALQRADIDDFRLLEEGDGVGGAWHWNRYPGIQVDIPSFSYQFSYAQRPDWSRVYAPGDELKAYAEHLVDSYGLRSRLRIGEPGRSMRLFRASIHYLTALFCCLAVDVLLLQVTR